MEGIFIAKAAAYIGAALVMGIGSISPAYGQGLVGAKACENIGKYPESSGDIRTAMYIAMGVIESSAVYSLIIALCLIFFT
jgi:F-type H+-transporting ATPase subunit c